jgi:hypothetical protein
MAYPELARLQQAWSPEWLVWRSRNTAGEPNEWCATRHGEGREFSMTLMERSADKLEAALCEQRELTGRRRSTSHTSGERRRPGHEGLQARA